METVLVVIALAFCWSMGAHYTGACMGMPYALKQLRAWQALLLMAPLSFLGAALASHRVEHTVAVRLTDHPLHLNAEVVVLVLAFTLTTVFTKLKIPTSTIQILVFSLAGVALGIGVGVAWATIGLLVLLWLAAPCVAACLGYGLTRLFDAVGARRSGRGRSAEKSTDLSQAVTVDTTKGAEESGTRRDSIGVFLILAGAAASFVMGSNDVANATGSLVATHIFSPLDAGVLGGVGLALGVVTWGRPLLNRIAFDIVKLDRSMATSAQLTQALVVITAVSFGLFTSMNQSLVGAMAGAGRARGNQTVNRSVLVGIVKGWFVGPGAAIAVAYLLSRGIVLFLGHHVLAS